ncbi:isoleucyl-tRNA synthetase [Hortaea werneckii]|nr:isoleucyl-tRNA synthetase [Hortaea werneckii]KAI7322529.1 isoleucyl-tRNA synthetase [Hortaea werneckii]
MPSPSRALRAATTTRTISDSLTLPRTTFPARASAADLARYRQRCADELYAWQRVHRPSSPSSSSSSAQHANDDFVLHDGPPYANGAVHVGHALNKILKDLILRSQLQRGRRVQYRPGWDCHGLPIELKALQRPAAEASGAEEEEKKKKAGSMQDAPREEADAARNVSASLTAAEVRRRARRLATETIERQMESFRSWGVMGEWERPYKTMDREFEIEQLGVFREMVRKGLVSRHHRPVYWSPSSRTALAEAELEYDDRHECTAAFVKMPMATLPKVLQRDGMTSSNFSALIWTTTPWTLPANKAIAVKDDIEYTVVKLSDEYLVIAKDRMEHIASILPPESPAMQTVVETVTGNELEGGACFNVFQGTESPIVCGDFVTATSGTGLVHIAPGHGMEDYQLCQKAGIGPVLAPVDDEGKLTAEAFPGNPSLLAGLDAQTEGVRKCLEILGNQVLLKHQFTHKNPIDWRTKQPVITRATAQWFADVSAIQAKAKEALNDVSFTPESGKTRLSSFLSGRSQWCISRQRAWGVPIPALYHKETGEACVGDESIEHIMQVFKQRGTDAWFEDGEDDLWLHSGLEKGKWVRGRDTMDVWFDSGTTWTTLSDRKDKPLSDVYVEGTDQHRGWFQSSLLTHTSVGGEIGAAPYGALITHGFILDADGKKMSKSLGNVIAPEQVVDGTLLPPIKARKQRGKKKDESVNDKPKYDSMGPDVLRLWVASSDYTSDVAMAVPVLQEVQQALQKYRVTFKWLLGCLADCDPVASKQHATDLTFADQAVLYRLSHTSAAIYAAYEGYEFHRGIKLVNNFFNNDLSAFYFEICKDGMYTGDMATRRRTQYVLATILDETMKWLGPVAPHLVEEAWEYFPQQLRSEQGSPLQQTWEKLTAQTSEEMEAALGEFQDLSAAVKLAQEEARRAGDLKNGLNCKVYIYGPQIPQRIRGWEASGQLASMLVVSQAEIGSDGPTTSSAWKYEQGVVLNDANDTVEPQYHVAVLPAQEEKCPRCWRSTAPDTETPCPRCQHVLEERGRNVNV